MFWGVFVFSCTTNYFNSIHLPCVFCLYSFFFVMPWTIWKWCPRANQIKSIIWQIQGVTKHRAIFTRSFRATKQQPEQQEQRYWNVMEDEKECATLKQPVVLLCQLITFGLHNFCIEKWVGASLWSNAT